MISESISNLYRILFDVAFEAVIVVDFESYKIMDANSRALELFGYSLDELLRLKITDLLICEDIKKEYYKAYIYCKKYNGSNFPAEVNATRLLYDMGELIIFNIRDITERLQKEKIEEDLKASERRYQAILDNLQEGFYQADEDNKIIFISQSALEMLGYTEKSEILGTSIKDHLVKPDDMEILLSRLDHAGGKLYEEEVEIINKNGNTLLISLNIQSVFDKNNNYIGTQGTFRDITEFKQKWNETIKLCHMVEGSQNALILMELDGTIVYANKAFLSVAHSPEWVTIKEHILNKKIKKFISFDQPITYESVLKTVIKTGKWFGSAYIFCYSNEKRIPIDILFSKIQNGEGKHYIVASAYDVSEYRKLEEKTREQSRLYEELSVSMEKLVEQMNFLNKKSYEKISNLEEEFKKTTSRFLMNYGERGEAVFDNKRVISQP